ncbi:MAG: sugar transporter, periplasmic ligand binding protein [Clostridia bacterium]|jgi:ribose transport system substrate-binding protein|nr:sugar transporter, periplasmic ligand binding protein [Clostridia bacterium]
MKKKLMIILALLLVISFGATNIYAELQRINNVTTSQMIYIPIIAKGLQAKFWDKVLQGAKEAADDHHITITFEGPVGEGNVDEQIIFLKNALEKHPGAIILSAVDAKAITPYLEEAREAGIPIIGFDSGVDSPIVRTTVATDNYGAGVLAAEKMAELLNKSGKVGIIVQDATSRVATDRRDGFVDTIEQRYPAMDVAAVGYGAGSVPLSAEVAKKIFREHPDIQGIFGANEGSAQGVVDAVRALDKEGEVTIIGFDSGKILLDAMREGFVAGAVTQKPADMGYLAVETAIRAFRGESLPAFIDTGFVWYDRSNLDSPEIQEHLYE